MKKHHYFILLIGLLALYSCSKQNPYEKIISDFAQTDKYGTKTDIQFKAIEIEEMSPIKVSDSINILKNKFEEDKKVSLNRQNEILDLYKGTLSKEEKSRIKSRTVIDRTKINIGNAENRIDSINKLQFKSIYDTQDNGKVLLIPVRCKYTYVFPKGDSERTRNEIFYFTPDKNKIVSNRQIDL